MAHRLPHRRHMADAPWLRDADVMAGEQLVVASRLGHGLTQL